MKYLKDIYMTLIRTVSYRSNSDANRMFQKAVSSLFSIDGFSPAVRFRHQFSLGHVAAAPSLFVFRRILSIDGNKISEDGDVCWRTPISATTAATASAADTTTATSSLYHSDGGISLRMWQRAHVTHAVAATAPSWAATAAATA